MSSSSFLPNIIKVCLRVSTFWSTQWCSSDFYFRGDNYITKKARVVSLYVILLVLLFIPTKYYQIIPNSMGVMACTRFCFRGDNYITKKLRIVSLARSTSTGPSLYSCQILSNYVSGYQSYGALKDVSMDFCFRRDNYKSKQVRVVSLDTPTGPSLYPYQILSNYLKQYGSYSLHKILASGKIPI